MSYTITFNKIVCLMPSSGSNLTADEMASKVLEIASKVADVASEISDIAGPEGEVVGAVLSVVGDLASIGAKIADLVEQIDVNRRNSGLDPDNFYITYGGWEAEKGARVLYPQQGTFAKGDEPRVDLAKGASAPNLPQSFSGLEPLSDPMHGMTYYLPVCFWDHDTGPDDMLVSIPVDDSSLGSFQRTIYNAVQDCMYYVEWTLTKD
jgi:hypothetical protein